MVKLIQFCCTSGLLDPTHQLRIKLNIKKVTEPVYMQGPNPTEPVELWAIILGGIIESNLVRIHQI